MLFSDLRWGTDIATMYVFTSSLPSPREPN